MLAAYCMLCKTETQTQKYFEKTVPHKQQQIHHHFTHKSTRQQTENDMIKIASPFARLRKFLTNSPKITTVENMIKIIQKPEIIEEKVVETYQR